MKTTFVVIDDGDMSVGIPPIDVKVTFEDLPDSAVQEAKECLKELYGLTDGVVLTKKEYDDMVEHEKKWVNEMRSIAE